MNVQTFSTLMYTLYTHHRSRHYRYVLEGDLTLSETLQAQPMAVIGYQNILAYGMSSKLFTSYCLCIAV